MYGSLLFGILSHGIDACAIIGNGEKRGVVYPFQSAPPLALACLLIEGVYAYSFLRCGSITANEQSLPWVAVRGRCLSGTAGTQRWSQEHGWHKDADKPGSRVSHIYIYNNVYNAVIFESTRSVAGIIVNQQS